MNGSPLSQMHKQTAAGRGGPKAVRSDHDARKTLLHLESTFAARAVFGTSALFPRHNRSSSGDDIHV